ncbi:MAG: glycosyltransferase family 39 protein [Pseudomonadota bacterium]
MKVFVAGGAGFIGSNLIARLLSGYSLFAAVILAAVVLRLYCLGERTLGVDEATALLTASPSVKDIWLNSFYQHLISQSHLPAYFWLLHFWMLLGKSEIVVRLPSVIMGLAAFPLMYSTMVKLYDSKAAKIACVLLAFSWLHIRYSQEARMYSLMVFLSLLSFYFFVRAIQQNQRRHWLAYVFFTAINLFTHIFCLILPLTQLIYLVFFYKGNKKKIAPYAILTLLTCLLIMFVIHNSYLMAMTANVRAARDIHFMPSVLAGLSSGHPSLPLGYISIPLFLAILCKPIYRAIRERQTESILLIVHFAIPFFTIAALSMLSTKIFIRYVIFLLPFYLMLVAMAISSIKTVMLGRALVILIILLNVVQLHHHYRYEEEPWREVGRFLEQRTAPDDAIVVIPGYYWIALDYYYKGGNEKLGLITGAGGNLDSIERLHRKKNVWLICDPSLNDYCVNLVGKLSQSPAAQSEFPSVFYVRRSE